MLDLFPSREAGPFAQAQARARRALAGDRRHRLPRRRQDHARPPLSRYTGRRRHRGGDQRVRQRRHRRCAHPRLDRRGDAARQRLPLLQHPLRPAGRLAQPRRRARARQGAAIPAHPDRDQRARRSRPDPADLRHRSRARRRVSRRGGARRDRRRERARHARLVGGGTQADHPRRPPGGDKDRPRQAGRARAPHRAPHRAQSAPLLRPRSMARSTLTVSWRRMPASCAPATIWASWPRPSTATAS